MDNLTIGISKAHERMLNLLQKPAPDQPKGPFMPADHRGSDWHGVETQEAIQNGEDRLLGALESRDDSLYDNLINPKTGMPYTEAEKLDAIQNAINREINAIESNRPILRDGQARLDELNTLLGDVEKSDIINTLSRDGIDVAAHPELVDDLGSPTVADAFVEHHGSEVKIEANTADAILEGELDIFNINDHTLEMKDTNGDGIDDTRIVKHPDTGEEIEVPAKFVGFSVPGTNDIWVSETDIAGNSVNSEDIGMTTVHEGNHGLNPYPDDYDTYTANEKAVYRYEREFVAYSVSGQFDDIAEDERAKAIRNHILKNYDWASDLDSSGIAAIESIEEPDADRFNLDNSFER